MARVAAHIGNKIVHGWRPMKKSGSLVCQRTFPTACWQRQKLPEVVLALGAKIPYHECGEDLGSIVASIKSRVDASSQPIFLYPCG